MKHWIWKIAGLLFAVAGAHGHQSRHLMLRQADLLAAKLGEA